jgi:hypothetical protein
MNIRVVTFLTFALVLGFRSDAFANTTIGGGYTCSGSLIKSHGKTVNISTAKNAIKVKYSAASSKLNALQRARASKSKIAKQKTVVNALKTVLSNLNACVKGKLDVQISSLWGDLSGTYSGTYTVTSPIPATGNIGTSFAVNGTVVTGSLSLDGLAATVLGISAPIGFQFDAKGITFPYHLQVPGTAIGDLTLTFTELGHISVDAVNVPANLLSITHIVLDAQKSINTINGTIDLRTTGEISLGTVEFSMSK